METAILAAQFGSSRPGFVMFVREYAGELPVSALRLFLGAVQTQAGWNARAFVLHGALPGLVFASVTRASRGARNAWLRSLEWGCLVRVFRGFNPVSSHVKVPSGRPRLGRLPFVSKKAFDVARDKVGRSTR